MTSTAAKASETIKQWFWVGLVVTVAGVILAVAAQPTEAVPSSTVFGADVEATGSEAAYFFGLVLAGVGSTMMWVGLIAYAVSLGVRAARN